MKIIDLLNKIAKGENPKKIKYYDDVYEFDCYEGEWGYVNKEYCRYKWFAKEIDCDLQEQLNDEVEIIEEEPRDIEVCGSLFTRSEYNRLAGIKEDKKIENIKVKSNFTHNQKQIVRKINEIIDYINKGDK